MTEYFDLYDLSVEDKFKMATKNLGINTPTIMIFYVMMQKKEVDEDITLRLNLTVAGSIILEYNKKFIEKIHPDSLAVLIYIECMRLVLHHCTKRFYSPANVNYLSSNLVITSKQVARLVTGNISIRNILKQFPQIEFFRSCFPANFNPEKDTFHERIFRWLRAEKDKEQNIMNSFFGDNSKTDSKSGDKSDKSNGKSKEKTQTKPKKERKPASQDKEEHQKSLEENEALQGHFSDKNMGKMAEEWAENKTIDEQIKSAVNNIEIKDWGNVPGSILQEIHVSNKRLVDPRIGLSNFNKSIMSSEFRYSRTKMNKHYGDEFLGIIPGIRFSDKSKVLLAIDSSGSMSDKDIKMGCQCVIDYMRMAEVEYCFWDAKCGEFNKSPRNLINQTTFKLTGRGGTNPSCVINKLNSPEHKNDKFDGIVYITDCYFDFPKPTISDKIFIIRTNDATNVPEWCKYSMSLKDVKEYQEI